MQEVQESTRTSARAAPDVLIVDDDPFAHTVMGEALGAMGIAAIHTALSGRKALGILSTLSKPPDFVICDVFMPDMDGFEFMDELVKQNYRGGVVIVSGVDAHMLDLTRVFAKTLGLKVRGAFVKPVAYQDLVQAISFKVTA